jgi:hypothetical protein
VWLRGPADVTVLADAGASPSPSPDATPGGSLAAPGSTSTAPGSPVAPALPIAAALRAHGERVRVEGVATVPATLLDGTGRRIIVEDRSAAVEVLLPVGTTPPRPGARLRIDGVLATAYGVPRIRADAVTSLGTGVLPAARDLRGAPGVADEGELVRVTGQVDDLLRLGDRWRAELRVGGATVVVAGLAGAAIPAAAVGEGSTVSVVGVVRRPHPAAADRRFAVVPRAPGDVRAAGSAPAGIAPAATGGSPSGVAGAASPPSREESGTSTGDGDGGAAAAADLAGLPGAGTLVRVGGLVVAIRGDRVLVDDGTATAGLRLTGGAADLLALLEPGDAVSAVGRVTAEAGAALVVVARAADLVRLGDLGEAVPLVPTDDGSGDAGEGEASPGPGLAGDASAATGTGGADRGPTTPPAPGSGWTARMGPLAAGAGVGLAIAGGGAALWAVAATARRGRDRRRLAARIASRLATVAAAAPGAAQDARPEAGRDAVTAAASGEHRPSVREPA